MSEANKDEALRCLSIAKQALQDGDHPRAEKFGQKALRLYRTDGVGNAAAQERLQDALARPATKVT
jgi:hypothetical protein